MIVMGHIKPKIELDKANLQGCYLFRHKKKGFIRSGKVACRSFKHRFQEHKRSAMWCEMLQFYSGLSFALVNPHTSLYATEADGIFVSEQSILDHMVRNENYLPISLQKEQLQFVAYLCELAYDLALSSLSNISSSSSFEQPLGIFERS